MHVVKVLHHYNEYWHIGNKLDHELAHYLERLSPPTRFFILFRIFPQIVEAHPKSLICSRRGRRPTYNEPSYNQYLSQGEDSLLTTNRGVQIQQHLTVLVIQVARTYKLAFKLISLNSDPTAGQNRLGRISGSCLRLETHRNPGSLQSTIHGMPASVTTLNN